MQLLLVNTTDKLQVVTGSAAAADVVATYMDTSSADPPVVKGSSSGRQLTAIATATTADIVAAPAASTLRGVKNINIRNKHATVATDVTVLYNANGTVYELHKVNLAPSEALEYVEGIGWFKIAAATNPALTNKSTAAQGGGFAADTYVTGSNLLLAGLGGPVIGTTYTWRLDITKTGAGTAAPVIIARVGTAGTTADTARCTLTFGPGTAVADTAIVTVTATFRSVGSGTSAVLVANANADCLPATGWSSTIKGVNAVSAGFDSTVANSIIGLSYNGGTSAVHTIQQVLAGPIEAF